MRVRTVALGRAGYSPCSNIRALQDSTWNLPRWYQGTVSPWVLFVALRRPGSCPGSPSCRRQEWVVLTETHPCRINGPHNGADASRLARTQPPEEGVAELGGRASIRCRRRRRGRGGGGGGRALLERGGGGSRALLERGGGGGGVGLCLSGGGGVGLCLSGGGGVGLCLGGGGGGCGFWVPKVP